MGPIWVQTQISRPYLLITMFGLPPSYHHFAAGSNRRSKVHLFAFGPNHSSGAFGTVIFQQETTRDPQSWHSDKGPFDTFFFVMILRVVFANIYWQVTIRILVLSFSPIVNCLPKPNNNMRYETSEIRLPRVANCVFSYFPFFFAVDLFYPCFFFVRVPFQFFTNLTISIFFLGSIAPIN